MGTFCAFSWSLIFWPNCEIFCDIFNWKCSELDGRVQKQNGVFSPSNLVVLSWNLLGTLLWPPCPSWEHLVHFCEVWFFGQNVKFWWYFLLENVQSWTVRVWKPNVFSPSNLVVLSWNLLGTLLWPPCPSWEHFVHFLTFNFLAKMWNFGDIFYWKTFRVGR